VKRFLVGRASCKARGGRRAMGERDIRPDDPDLGKFFNLKTVDHMVRQAVMFCWMMLPKDRRTGTNLRWEVRRIVARALKDLREDAEAFGMPRME